MTIIMIELGVIAVVTTAQLVLAVVHHLHSGQPTPLHGPVR